MTGASKGGQQVRAAAVGAVIAGVFGVAVALLGNATNTIAITVGEPQAATTVILPGPTVTVPAPGPTVTVTPQSSDDDEGVTLAGGDETATYLADLDPVNGYAEREIFSLRGEKYPRALGQRHTSPECGEAESIEFDLGNRYQTLRVNAGIADHSPDAQLRAIFSVYADDEQLHEVELGLREVDEMVIPIAGRFRVRLETVAVAASTSSCQETGYAVWGDPRLT